MHTILQCAPNISDLYLTLYIGGLDNVKGLCSGLSLINPRRVIVVDCPGQAAPKKNKKVTELLGTLSHVIEKWDKNGALSLFIINRFLEAKCAAM
jgi:hypothetical protein